VRSLQFLNLCASPLRRSCKPCVPPWPTRGGPQHRTGKCLGGAAIVTLVSAKLTSFPTSRMRQPITVASTRISVSTKRGSSAETIGYVATNTAGNTATSTPSSNQQPRQPEAQFQLGACSAPLGYLIVAVSQMEVLWPLAVSVGSPEVVSVMRPADFNSGMPFLTVFALPTRIFN
jgi:hypothetical protein